MMKKVGENKVDRRENKTKVKLLFAKNRNDSINLELPKIEK